MLLTLCWLSKLSLYWLFSVGFQSCLCTNSSLLVLTDGMNCRARAHTQICVCLSMSLHFLVWALRLLFKHFVDHVHTFRLHLFVFLFLTFWCCSLSLSLTSLFVVGDPSKRSAHPMHTQCMHVDAFLSDSLFSSILLWGIFLSLTSLFSVGNAIKAEQSSSAHTYYACISVPRADLRLWCKGLSTVPKHGVHTKAPQTRVWGISQVCWEVGACACLSVLGLDITIAPRHDVHSQT